MSDMKLVVTGAGGRMGRTIIRAIHESEGVTLWGALEREGSAHLGQDAGELAGIGQVGVAITADPLPSIAQADGIIDFSSPAATVANAGYAAQARIVHVIGTTGCSAEDDAAIKAAARHAVIVKSGNMSLGINLLAVLVEQAARALSNEFDIEVLEMHHRHKVDAPSGTALLLGEAAAAGRAIGLDDNAVRVRDGHTGPRPDGKIGFATLRGGSVIGEHATYFAGPAETIVLSHKAEDRAIFANGALKAALWARGQKPGLYSMRDVLGLSRN
ncbi:MAG: 4-hydroxy-tetrahydrodipicolinate reductase [Rhizobiaceae bacterium]